MKFRASEDAFEKAAKDYEELASRMQELRDEIDGLLEGLQEGFDTPAGRKFVKSCKKDLLRPMKDQAAIIKHVSKNVNTAKTEYQTIFSEYKKLNEEINNMQI